MKNKRSYVGKIVTIAAIGGYSLFGGLTYSEENKEIKPYETNDPVFMIHKENVNRPLKKRIIEKGGVETVVAGTDTVYITKEFPKFPDLSEKKDLGKIVDSCKPTKKSKEQKWYQNRWVQIGAGAGLAVLAGYIGSQINDKDHSHKHKQDTPETEYDLPEEPADIGKGGGRTDEGSIGGNRDVGSVGGGR